MFRHLHKKPRKPQKRMSFTRVKPHPLVLVGKLEVLNKPPESFGKSWRSLALTGRHFGM